MSSFVVLQDVMTSHMSSIRQQKPMPAQALADDAYGVVVPTEHVGLKKSCDMFHLKPSSFSVHLLEKWLESISRRRLYYDRCVD